MLRIRAADEPITEVFDDARFVDAVLRAGVLVADGYDFDIFVLAGDGEAEGSVGFVHASETGVALEQMRAGAAFFHFACVAEENERQAIENGPHESGHSTLILNQPIRYDETGVGTPTSRSHV